MPSLLSVFRLRSFAYLVNRSSVHPSACRFIHKLEFHDVIDAEASSEVHGVGAYAPWSRTCVASSPQLNFSPAFPGKNQRHLWFFEIAYDDLRPDLHIDS